ncbi:hypothetical protein RchiOBHm_Chr5g0051241 [Rosa chinensis]|uniref:26S proteasome non-ATPase regulatory subunit 1/RPN2 N-terminal domain-containing protein n=1 Tax=Rosa chinensis TaxID=74649 RepID=A0A2P6QFB1_ROSCH|nr:hypothetical protein RchiOBHm_Chr5g0051241 [Rosa chinensis]
MGILHSVEQMYYEGQFAPISEIDVEEVEAPAVSVVEATKKELETALMEMVKQDNGRQLHARFVWRRRVHQRLLATLLASQGFYYFGELNDSLSYALGAGSLFDVQEDYDYIPIALLEVNWKYGI